jgi:hypothetical protein
MTTVSADDGSSSPLALQVILLMRRYVLPWSQFLYAEGGNDEVRLTYETHDVLIKGSNLDHMLDSECS